MRRLTLVAAVVVALSACGGSTDGTVDTSPPATSGDTTVAEDATTSLPDVTTTTGEPDSGQPVDMEPGTGVVVLGGTEYEFDISGQCEVQDGAMGASGPMADGTDGNVEAILPPEEMQAEFGKPYVLVGLADAETWVAQEGYQPQVGEPPTSDESAVTSFEVSGDSATGTAVFWETGGAGSVEGSFAFLCP